MNLEKIKIELNNEEVKLVQELNSYKEQISELQQSNLNNDLMESIKQKSIETITMALGVSDILEKRGHSNALEASKEYKSYQEWENSPSENRSKTYKAKYLHQNEFSSLIDTAKNTTEYSKEVRSTYLGKEFAERKNQLYREGKPFSAIDGYTGKRINRFDKDLSKTSHVEHIKSVHEVHNDPSMQKYFNQEERKKIINSKDNTCLTRADINISKGKKNTEETKQWASENQERFELDTDKVNKKLNKSNEKFDNEKINKQILYKHKEQIQIAGNNALKSGAKAAIGKLLTITTIEIIDEFKDNKDSQLSEKAKNIKDRIINKTKDIITTFKDHSISSFISTLVDALLNSIFKILKNILKFIKTAFYSIIKAFKVLLSDSYTKEEKLSECRKILGVTVATMIGLVLEELIEKAMIASFPFTAPFAGYISPIISGLIVGIGSVIIMNSWEKYKNNFEIKRLEGEVLVKTDINTKISLTKANVASAESSESIAVTFSVFKEVLPVISESKKYIEENLRNIQETSKFIKETIVNTSEDINDTDDLLNSLELQ